jgi:hypothetical protein
LVGGAYPDGNWLRTVLLYTLWKTQGTWVEEWKPGVRVGADRNGHALYVTLESAEPWTGRLRFDHARHRRVLNLSRNYVRLNEWPDWYVVDGNTLYEVTGASGREQTLLGSDLKDGVPVSAPARVMVRPAQQ